MKVGQLWYTRALQGAEGTNKFQILAASGRLDDRTRPLTQAALASCYRPIGPTLSWSVERGAVVVTNRVVVDDEKANRAGIFFVHALVGPPEALPPDALGRMWGASGWREQAPDPVPAKLEPLPDIHAMGLRPATMLDEGLVAQVVAGFLRNARDHRRSAVDLEPSIVAALAARLEELLPTRRDALGFCSQPDDEQVERYAVTAGVSRSARFRPIDLEAAVDDDGRLVNDLLLEARRGDGQARRVLASIDAHSRELSHLAGGLLHWARVDRRPGAVGSVPTSEALRFVGADPALVEALITGEGRATVADGIADGIDGIGPLVAVAQEIGCFAPAVEPTCAVLGRLAPATAAGRIVALAGSSIEAAATLTVPMVESWAARGSLVDLPGPERAGLLGILARHEPRLRTVPHLLVDARSAPLIVAVDEMPSAWRARAIVHHHDVIADAAIGGALARSWALARGVATDLDGESTAFLGRALGTLDPAEALQVIGVLERIVERPRTSRWTAEALTRLRPTPRIEAAIALARDRRALAPEAADAVVDAIETSIIDVPRSRGPAPDLRSLAPVLEAVDDASPRVLAWSDVCRWVRELQGFHGVEYAGRAARAAASMPPPLRAPTVVAVLRVVNAAGLDWFGWFDAVGAVEAEVVDLEEPSWLLLVQSTWVAPRTVRDKKLTPRSLRYRVALHLALAVEAGTMARSDLRTPAVARFVEDLTSDEVHHLERRKAETDPPGLPSAIAKLLRKGALV